MGRFELKILTAVLAPAAVALVAGYLMVEVMAREILRLGVNADVAAGLASPVALLRDNFDLAKQLTAADAYRVTRNRRFVAASLLREREPIAELVTAFVADKPWIRRVEVFSTERHFAMEGPLTREEHESAAGVPPSGLLYQFVRPGAPAERATVAEIVQDIPSVSGARLVIELGATAEQVAAMAKAREQAEIYAALNAQAEDLTGAYSLAFAVIFGLTVFAATLTGVVIARRATNRIVVLAEAMNRVGEGDLRARVEPEGDDEVADLMDNFNRMVEETRQSRDRILYLEKVSSWQEIARRIAHQIKNPLTPIQLAVQELENRAPKADPAYAKLVGDATQIVTEEIAVLRRLTEEFSAFARLPAVRPVPADVASAVAGVLKAVAPPGHIRIETAFGEEPLTAALDAAMFRQVLKNLIDNACDAIGGESGVIRVTAARVGRRVRLTIADDGPGIDPGVAARLFEPYLTTKEWGTGLGLAIAKKIVLEHGGAITAGRSEALGGAEIVIDLPFSGALPVNGDDSADDGT